MSIRIALCLLLSAAAPAVDAQRASDGLIEKRNAASGYAGTLKFAVGRAARTCRDVLGRDDQYMRGVADDWVRRNAKFAAAAERWTTMYVTAIAEARGTDVALRARDQIMGTVQRDALKAVDAMLGPEGETRRARCETLAATVASGAYDITESAPLYDDLRELVALFERATPN